MAGGSQTNLGGQQVSIYPFQTLSSALGNELLYGVLVPGVSGAGLTITPGAGTNINFNIEAGTQLIFQRQAPDVNSVIQSFIGKIVLTSNALLSFSRADLWVNVPTFVNTKNLYLVADWTYNTSAATTIYVSFSIETDSSIAAIRLNDGGFNHQLIVATILNQQFFVNSLIGLTGAALTSAISSANLSHYHISYDAQNQRNPLSRLYNANQDFVIDFDPSGRGVYVENGQVLTSGTVLNYTPTFDGTWGTAPGPTGTFPLRTAGVGQINPPAALLTFVNPVNNVAIYVAPGTQGNYYQVDFLRIKSDEVAHGVFVGWESFLRPSPSAPGISWVGGTPVSLDFDGYSITNMTQANLLAYLAALPPPYNQFQFAGEGTTLLISIRLLGSLGSWAGIPTTDGSTNLLWPESCINMKDQSIHAQGMSPQHQRFKLPVWQSSDIGQ